jgi:hypothetical protein
MKLGYLANIYLFKQNAIINESYTFLICIVGGGSKVHSTLRPLNGLNPILTILLQHSIFPFYTARLNEVTEELIPWITNELLWWQSFLGCFIFSDNLINCLKVHNFLFNKIITSQKFYLTEYELCLMNVIEGQIITAGPKYMFHL